MVLWDKIVCSFSMDDTGKYHFYFITFQLLFDYPYCHHLIFEFSHFHFISHNLVLFFLFLSILKSIWDFLHIAIPHANRKSLFNIDFNFFNNVISEKAKGPSLLTLASLRSEIGDGMK